MATHPKKAKSDPSINSSSPAAKGLPTFRKYGRIMAVLIVLLIGGFYGFVELVA